MEAAAASGLAREEGLAPNDVETAGQLGLSAVESPTNTIELARRPQLRAWQWTGIGNPLSSILTDGSRP